MLGAAGAGRQPSCLHMRSICGVPSGGATGLQPPAQHQDAATAACMAVVSQFWFGWQGASW